MAGPDPATTEWVPIWNPTRGFGTGVAGRLGIWADTTTMTSDAELSYNATTNSLGLGVAPYALARFKARGAYGDELSIHYTSLPYHVSLELNPSTLVPGSVTNWFGIAVSNPAGSLSAATGLWMDVAAGTGRYNIYAAGAAPNYLQGSLGIGTESPTSTLDVNGSARISGNLGIGTEPDPDVGLLLHHSSGAEVRIQDGRESHFLGGITIEANDLVPASVPYWIGLNLGSPPAAVPATSIYSHMAPGPAGTERFNIYAAGLTPSFFDGNVGIGNTTPSAPLSFGNVLGPKIDIWYTAGARYGIGLQGGQMQIYADPSGLVRLGNMDNAGTTFTTRFEVGATQVTSYMPMGVQATPEPASYALTTNGIHCYSYSRFEYLTQFMGGLGAYAACTMPSLRLGDSVAPVHTLDVNGTAYFRSHVAAVGGSLVVGPGYLQCADNYLYIDGRYGIDAQNTTDYGTFALTDAIFGNPSWNKLRVRFAHIYGSWAGMQFATDAAGCNEINFHISGANAYINIGSWVDAPSDRRVKRHVTPIDTPLARLAKLHGSHYERTDLKTIPGFPAPQTQEYGLIAQDVAEALPEAAFEHDYGPERGKLWNFHDRPVLALLVESVKALVRRVEALEGA